MKILLLILLLSLPVHAQTIVVEAESMMIDPNLGGPNGPGMMIWSNGSLQTTINVPVSSLYHMDIVARGESAQGVAPSMDVRIDSVVVSPILVTSASFVTYAIGIPPLSAGNHSFSISFTNDYNSATEDRNLVIDKTTFYTAIIDPLPVTPTTVTEGKWKLQWDPNAESDLAGYRVYRSENGSYGTALGSTMQPTYQDLTASAGHTYYYVVTAYDMTGNESLHSNTVVAVIAPSVVPVIDTVPPQVGN